MADLIERDALLKDMGLTDAVKYGNKDSEQQTRSYSTWMSYEIADAIQDAPAVNRWIPCSERMPEKDTSVIIYAAGHAVCLFAVLICALCIMALIATICMIFCGGVSG